MRGVAFLAKGKCRGLGEGIGGELGVVVAHVLRRPCCEQEIDRDDVGALMQELEKGMLCVGSRLAPDHGSGGG